MQIVLHQINERIKIFCIHCYPMRIAKLLATTNLNNNFFFLYINFVSCNILLHDYTNQRPITVRYDIQMYMCI